MRSCFLIFFACRKKIFLRQRRGKKWIIWIGKLDLSRETSARNTEIKLLSSLFMRIYHEICENVDCIKKEGLQWKLELC